MRFSIAAASAALLALAEARITGIKVPKEIAVGEPFEAIIVRENYIQSVFDSSIVFGYAPESQYPGTIGQVANSFALGKSMFPSPNLPSISLDLVANTTNRGV
jgi:hypothetical protein